MGIGQEKQAMNEPEYKSLVLQCNHEDDGCSVCRFLNGSRDTQVLMDVIAVLDNKLHREEMLCFSLRSALAWRGQSIRMDADVFRLINRIASADWIGEAELNLWRKHCRDVITRWNDRVSPEFICDRCSLRQDAKPKVEPQF